MLFCDCRRMFMSMRKSNTKVTREYFVEKYRSVSTFFYVYLGSLLSKMFNQRIFIFLVRLELFAKCRWSLCKTRFKTFSATLRSRTSTESNRQTGNERMLGYRFSKFGGVGNKVPGWGERVRMWDNWAGREWRWGRGCVRKLRHHE